MKDIVYGEILSIEGDYIRVVCSLNENADEPGTYYLQVREFHKSPLFELFEPIVNGHIKIIITSKPGSRTTSIEEVKEDISYRFVKKDYFKDMENSPFFNKDKATKL